MPHGGNPIGRCKIGANCNTIPLYINAGLMTERTAPRCEYETPFSKLMYCCPDDPPPSREIPSHKTPSRTNPSSEFLTPQPNL